MRISLVLLAAFLTAAPALGADDAEKVIDQAIKAHGGADALSKANRCTRSMTGTMILNGMDLNFSQELTLDLPDRYRLETELGADKRKLTIIVNGDKGWRVAGGTTQEISPEGLNVSREEGHVIYLSSLVPLRRDKGYTLKLLADAKVQGKPASVVQVTLKGKADAQLYFDKDSGLLVKISRKTAIAGLLAQHEYTFADHKTFSGVTLPTRWQELINGARYLDGKVLSYSFSSSPDDKLFAKP
jgi:hypothetical protein